LREIVSGPLPPEAALFMGLTLELILTITVQKEFTSQSRSNGFLRVTDQTFASQVLASDTPVLVDFWAPWGDACSRLGRELEQVAENLASRARAATLNVAENPATASHYGIASVPTLRLFRGGRVVAQVIGLAHQQTSEEKLAPELG
jgi:thioredoxin 1